MPNRTLPNAVQHGTLLYPNTPRTPGDQVRVLVGDLNAIQHSAGTVVLLRYLAATIRHLPAIITHRSLLPADHGMPRRSYAFRMPGGAVYLDTSLDVFREESLFGGAREIYCRQVYSARSGFMIQPGDVVFDLGANKGLFTTMAAVEGATVVAVEAQSRFLPCIDANLRVNGVVNRAHVHHALIGGTIGILAAGRSASDGWLEEPPDTSIPALLDEHHLDHIDLLKVDIEGSEFALFTPHSQWLNSVSRIVGEVHRQYGDVIALGNILRSFGFKVELLDQDGHPTAILPYDTGYLFAYRPAPDS
jgi:FkbM family methyltransferase